MEYLLYCLAGIALLNGLYVVAALLVIGGAFLSVYRKSEAKKLQLVHEQQEENQQAQLDQREYDAYFQQWGVPHRDDEVRLKTWAEKDGISYREAADKAFDHYCFVVHDPIQEVRKDAMELIKRMPEALAIAAQQGYAVELGSRDYYHSPLDKGITWGESRLPACKVTKDEQVTYYFPAEFVRFALNGCLAPEDEREGKYPYNEQGQAQLQRLFIEGQPKTEADEKLERQ
jgi:hypothetical protein